MRIKEDIKIYTKDIDIANRITLSTGACFIEIPEANHGYSYKGYAPLEPWLSPTLEELSLLVGKSSPKENHNGIGIGKISKKLLQTSKSLEFDLLSTEEEIEQIHKNERYNQYVSEILDYFKDNILNRYGLNGPLVSFRHPHNLKTATTNKYRKTYMGLHMDSWDPYSWRERHLARNRICINLGQEMRYFLFVNLTANRIINMIEHEHKTTFESIREQPYLPHVFFETFPKYKVVKLGLEPGEYYIAPTENMIHDSTMIGKRCKDIFLTIWGYFNPSPI